MEINLVTKQDIHSLEEKISELVATFQANEKKGLGIVYDTKELAGKLKVSTKTISNWREDRLLEFCKVHNTILYTEKAVLEFLASHCIKRRNNIVNRIKSLNHE